MIVIELIKIVLNILGWIELIMNIIFALVLT